MSELFWIIGATFVVSIISFIGIIALSLRKDFLMKVLILFVAFAAGSLLGVAIFDLIPEAIHLSIQGPIYIIIGILIFFAVERFVGWHHSHHQHTINPSSLNKPYVYTNLIGEAVHNFIDGTLIAASFLSSIPLGIAVTIAVILHEIPQEIGDFAILIHGGLKVKKALFYNFLVAVTAVAGGIITFYLTSLIENLTPLLIGVAGGGFLYLALTDLLPEIHKENNWKLNVAQFSAIVFGLAVLYYMTQAIHV